MIKIINLTKIFRTESVQTTALNEVSLEISQGEFVAIMGPYPYNPRMAAESTSNV